MRLYYWVAEFKGDAPCYSAIGRSQAECREEMQEVGSDKYEEPVRKMIEYSDGFDLFRQLTQEGGNRLYGRETKKGPR